MSPRQGATRAVSAGAERTALIFQRDLTRQSVFEGFSHLIFSEARRSLWTARKVRPQPKMTLCKTHSTGPGKIRRRGTLGRVSYLKADLHNVRQGWGADAHQWEMDFENPWIRTPPPTIIVRPMIAGRSSFCFRMKTDDRATNVIPAPDQIA